MTDPQINGAKIFVEDTGGRGAPILFIHGLMLPSTSWHVPVDRFRATHRVITYDCAGRAGRK
jgi:pimeloyl-ACP methyl ester carboxylesterase